MVLKALILENVCMGNVLWSCKDFFFQIIFTLGGYSSLERRDFRQFPL